MEHFTTFDVMKTGTENTEKAHSMDIYDKIDLEKYAHSLVSDKSLVLPDNLSIYYSLNQELFISEASNNPI